MHNEMAKFCTMEDSIITGTGMSFNRADGVNVISNVKNVSVMIEKIKIVVNALIIYYL